MHQGGSMPPHNITGDPGGHPHNTIGAIDIDAGRYCLKMETHLADWTQEVGYGASLA